VRAGSSIAGRAALALALMVGFYGLALAIASGLAWIPYAEWQYAHRFQPKIALFCLGGAFLILKSIVPRPDHFEPPGPRLIAGKQPRLFAELLRIATATGQAPPSEVYLVPDVNAWVSQRGGLMGLGSRRVMGLGLPLLQVLSISELRAVLAHEFGHYHGGDVKVGPWIYKTREALVRTLQNLAGHSGVLTKPFDLYARLFFRVSHAVSRHQELLADALAARVAGGAALSAGLKAVHGASLAFGSYWTQEVSPLLSAGFLPPLAAGFASLVEQPTVTARLRELVDEEARTGKRDPYDTHPSLQERLAALSRLPAGAATRDDARAITLVDGVASLEKQLVAHIAGNEGAPKLEPLAWEDVGARVLVPHWEAFLREHAFALSGLTPASLPALDWASLGRKVAQSAKRDDDDPLPAADYAVGAGVGLALSRAGFAVESPPGAPVTLVRDEARVEPFSLRSRLAADAKEAEAWRGFCAQAGIADVELGRQALDKVAPPGTPLVQRR
jgi:heat shock protein HtpX